MKHASTVADVFASGPGGGDSQAARYRADRVAVWVTDAIGWSNITVVDDLSRPICHFRDDSGGDDEVAVAQLRLACWTVYGVRPHFALDTAVAAVGAVIATIDDANIGSLTSGWEVVRDALKLPLDGGLSGCRRRWPRRCDCSAKPTTPPSVGWSAMVVG